MSLVDVLATVASSLLILFGLAVVAVMPSVIYVGGATDQEEGKVNVLRSLIFWPTVGLGAFLIGIGLIGIGAVPA